MNLASTCSIQWSPLHCDYDKRSKGIIRTIESLENALILPKISHSISVIIANFDILLGVSQFHLIDLHQSPALEVKGQCSHNDLSKNCVSYPSEDFRTIISSHTLYIKIGTQYLNQKVRYQQLYNCSL